MSIARYAVALLSSVSAVSLAHAAIAADAPPPPQTPPDSSTTVQGVVVTAPRVEVQARKAQQDAINVINVQSAETIQKYPDFNAAEALGRMPGISITTDTGEGRFVNIRGIDSNLNGATFGGVPQLNTFPGGTEFSGGGRAVEFDTVPTGSIDGIILTKTTLPDHEAEGLGGTIELTPRSAAHVEQPFFDGTLGYGYEPEHDHGGPFDIDAAVGARFGFANGHMIVQGRDDTSGAGMGWISNPTPFSFVLTASRMDDFRGFDDIEEDYNDPTSDRSYKDLELRRYDYHRRRFGYGGDFEFTPNDDHSYYLRVNVAGYTESVTKNRLTYNYKHMAQTPDGDGFDADAALSITSTDEEETHRNSVFAAGGQDKFGGGIVLDYRVSYSRATYESPYSYGAEFDGPTVATFYNNKGHNGDFPIIKVTDGTNINDPSLYTLGSVSDSAESDVDQEWAYAANLLIPVHLFGDNDAFKIGGEARLRDKVSDPYIVSDASDPGSGNLTLPALSLDGLNVPPITNFYGGRYSNGPGVATDAIRALVAGIPTVRTLDPTAFFAAKENIYAGYAQFTSQIGSWRFLAGVRVESTDATYSAFSDDNATETFNIVDRTDRYTNFFPTVQARYDFTPNFLVRATWSTGIGRPGFLQNTAATQSNHDPSAPAITQGNPDLKPTTGDNFDLSFEYYLNDGGILQFGLFDKEFRNYIVTDAKQELYTGTDPVFIGQDVLFTTFSNVAHAYARGAEVAYHQQFKWLPDPWNGFGVEANITLVDSKFEEYNAATSANGVAAFGSLPGTSHRTWNLAGFYEADGFEARLAAEYVGPTLFALDGADQTLDTIQDKRLTLDYTMSYKFEPGWKVYFAAKNLTNEPLRFYYREGSDFPIQREFYLTTYEFGVKAKF